MAREYEMPKIGDKVNKLTVLEVIPAERGSKKRTMVRCLCDCGSEAVVQEKRFRSGHTKSCGCHKEKRQGLSRSREFNIWRQMMERCCNADHWAYPWYGGRGITVYEPWKEFFVFLADVGESPGPGFSLDRFPNNDGNYEPGNVRWATDREQSNNKRNNRLIGFNGKTQTLAQWAREVGIMAITLHHRLKKGWPMDKAMTTPLRKMVNNRKPLP